MKAFFTMSMILEIEDLPGVEEMRESMERSGWDSMIASMRDGLAERGEELTQEVIDEAILFYGVQAWPLPSRGSFTESKP